MAAVRPLSLSAIGACVLLLMAACGDAEDGANEEAAADHFDGATVHLSVPANPGGGYDQYARLLAPHLAEELGASNVVVNNEPEAGGLVALNNLLGDDSDGLHLVLMNGVGVAGSTIAGAEGADFELDDFRYVGRVMAEPNVWVAGRSSEVGNLEHARTTPGFRFGATGPGASAYVYPSLLAAALDLPDTEIVTGFDSANESAVAATRGDIDGLVGGIASRLTPIEDGDHVAILSLTDEPHPQLPDTPAIGELELDDDQNEIVDGLLSLIAMGRPVAAAPDVPPAHLEFLRAAFERAIERPELVEEAAAVERPLDPLSGEEMQELAASVADAPDAFRDALTAAY